MYLLVPGMFYVIQFQIYFKDNVNSFCEETITVRLYYNITIYVW